MTQVELAEKMTKTFREYDPDAQVEVHRMSDSIYWGKIVSRLWTNKSAATRSRLALHMLDNDWPEIRKSAKIVIIAISYEDDSIN